MAERRMFAKTIVLSDAFLDMPMSARCLYFTLGVSAYDKGIVINARSTAVAIGGEKSDVDLLVERGFLTPTDDGNYRITHWYENNGIGETAKKRNNYAYRSWRGRVLKRDGFRCQQCGSTEDLNVHHIMPFAQYPELRFEVSNGITLCESCHKEHHRKERERGEETDV